MTGSLHGKSWYELPSFADHMTLKPAVHDHTCKQTDLINKKIKSIAVVVSSILVISVEHC